MSAGASKRVVAEMRFGEDRAGVSKVGGRSIHQYWSMLSPHFRDVLLAPQRRSDDGGVSWTWREPEEKQPIAPADLASVRTRLARAAELFEENPVNPLLNEQAGGGASSQEIVDQLTARVKGIVESLAGKTDAALAEFVCRTETGVMVHSWGLMVAAKIFYPDSLESGISGVVVFGGKGSVGNDVIVENAKGLRVARTTTDDAGEFRFTKLAPGRYRVRVISGPGEFSKKGVTVTVERGETSRLELRSTSDPESATATESESLGESNGTGTSAPVSVQRRRSKLWMAAGALLFIIGGLLWFGRGYLNIAGRKELPPSRISTLTPEKFSSVKPSANSEPLSRNGAGTGLGAFAAASGGPQTQTTPLDAPLTDGPTSGPMGESSASFGSKIGTRVELSDRNDPDLSRANLPQGRSVARNSTAPTGNSSASSLNSEDAAMAPEIDGPETSSLEQKKIASPSSSPISEKMHPTNSGAGPEVLLGHDSSGMGGGGADVPAGNESEKKGSIPSADLPVGKGKSGTTKNSGLPISDRRRQGSWEENSATEDSSEGSARDVARGQIAGQGPKVAVNIVQKPAKKTAAATPAASDAPPVNSLTGSPAESDTGGSQDAAAVKPIREKGTKPSSEKKDREAAGVGDGKTLNGDASQGQAAAVGMAGKPAESEKDESGKISDNPPLEPKSDQGVEKAQIPAEFKNEAKAQSQNPASALQRKPFSEDLKIVGNLKFGNWSLYLASDAIVPTNIVEEGKADELATLRAKMIAERKARLPQTLRRPKLFGGFAFKFIANAKVQPLRWKSEEKDNVSLGVADNRAEVEWPLTLAPSDQVLTLVYSDGVEAARIEFDHEGNAIVATRPELRAMLLVGALYAEADLGINNERARVSWQVLGGPLASTAWMYDSRWRAGTGCRLELVLNGASPTHTRIALMDQLSGWRLATELR